MKAFVYFIFLLQTLLIGCNDAKDFKVGDCIQKPDSVIVWQIKGISKGNYTIYQKQDKREPSVKTIELDGVWSKSNCPGF